MAVSPAHIRAVQKAILVEIPNYSITGLPCTPYFPSTSSLENKKPQTADYSGCGDMSGLIPRPTDWLNSFVCTVCPCTSDSSQFGPSLTRLLYCTYVKCNSDSCGGSRKSYEVVLCLHYTLHAKQCSRRVVAVFLPCVFCRF